MKVSDCIDAYGELSRMIFKLSWIKGNPAARGLRAAVGAAQFDSETLKKAIFQILEKYLPKERRGNRSVKDVPFLCDTDKCKVFVVAAQYADGAPTLIRNYTSSDSPENMDFKIFEAAIATSAAPTYFSHFSKQREGNTDTADFVDGGIGSNNPILHLDIERKKFFGDRKIGYVISVGTGIATTATEVSTNPISLAKKILSILTDCKSAHTLFNQLNRDYKYFRFAADGLDGIALDEWSELQKIRQITSSYLAASEWLIGDCIKLMKKLNDPNQLGEVEPLNPEQKDCMEE
ncbi:uncharacterized protein H6S33_009882 [Morchella sextelata]|nr:uncharacterized protein H6S33_009882 [Morchella sextelata]KAH0602241.1 hypothetical protein H6S33_009882 [Morchella sextelata]